MYILSDDRLLSCEAQFVSQAQVDLSGRVRMCFQPANDSCFEWIENANTWGGFARAKLFTQKPFGHGAAMHAQFAVDLWNRQLPVLVIVLDFAVQFVVDHGWRAPAS